MTNPLCFKNKNIYNLLEEVLENNMNHFLEKLMFDSFLDH